MRFTTAACTAFVLAAATTTTDSRTATAFQPASFGLAHPRQQQQPQRTVSRLRLSSSSSSPVTKEDKAADAAAQKQQTKKEGRLRMMKSDQFYRQGFKEVRESVETVMGRQFQSPIVNDLKTNNYVMERDNVKVYLAKVSSLLSVSSSSRSSERTAACVVCLCVRCLGVFESDG